MRSNRLRLICIIELLAAAWAVRADTHQVTKISVEGRDTVITEFRQGKNERTEVLPPGQTVPSISIHNVDQKKSVQLDLKKREYTEFVQQNDLILSLAMWLRRSPRVLQSGKTVHIYYETVDTNERKQFFGQTARHLHLVERRVAENGACLPSQQVDRDGWYIAGGQTEYGAYVVTGNVRCEDTIVKHGQPNHDLAVEEKQGNVTRQILELSQEPLDPQLFEIPPGFKRVDVESHQWGSDWYQLHRAIKSWFE